MKVVVREVAIVFTRFGGRLEELADRAGVHGVTRTHSRTYNRLVGLVVKASASRAEDPGFESRLPREFFGVESYQ